MLVIVLRVYLRGQKRPLVTVEYVDYELAQRAAENIASIGAWVDDTLYPPYGIERIELVEEEKVSGEENDIFPPYPEHDEPVEVD